MLEFTEAIDPADYDRVAAVIRHLDVPVMIAMDDTGAGYSSLRAVLSLRPEFIKLDLGLVHEIERDAARQALIGGMVRYVSDGGARLIAEGVETEAERRTLVRLGAKLGQGHLFGLPSADGAVVALPELAPGAEAANSGPVGS